MTRRSFRSSWTWPISRGRYFRPSFSCQRVCWAGKVQQEVEGRGGTAGQGTWGSERGARGCCGPGTLTWYLYLYLYLDAD